jgi:hypothetical protein
VLVNYNTKQTPSWAGSHEGKRPATTLVAIAIPYPVVPQSPHRPAETRAMNDTPPDRLAMDPRSKFHDAEAIERGVGVRFKGEEKNNVEEYCVSEGWVRLPVGKSLDRRGNAMTMKFMGDVEVYFHDAP